MKFFPGFIIFSSLILNSYFNFAQELIINDFQENTLDVSAREFSVTDINGDLCSLIKVRTGLDEVNFFSNLSIEKVEHNYGEYWLWVSPGTNQLKIAVQDFPLLEFDLPAKTKGSTVYVILLTAIFPDQIIYRDTIQPFISFSSDPPGADIYINGYLQGETPLKINIPDSIYDYSVEKKKFKLITGSDTNTNTIISYSFDLEIDPKAKRYYGLLTYGVNTYEHSRVSTYSVEFTKVIGLQIGRLGKTGFYGSFNFSHFPTKHEVEYLADEEIIIPLEDMTGYSYTYDPILYPTKKDRFNLFRISVGSSFQFGKSVFLNTGIGYSHSKFYNVVLKSPITNIGSSYPNLGPGTEYVYSFVPDRSFRGPNVDLGLIVRVKNSILIYLGSTINFRYIDFDNDEINTKVFKYHYSDLKFGIGYNF